MYITKQIIIGVLVTPILLFVAYAGVVGTLEKRDQERLYAERVQVRVQEEQHAEFMFKSELVRIHEKELNMQEVVAVNTETEVYTEEEEGMATKSSDTDAEAFREAMLVEERRRTLQAQALATARAEALTRAETEAKALAQAQALADQLKTAQAQQTTKTETNTTKTTNTTVTQTPRTSNAS